MHGHIEVITPHAVNRAVEHTKAHVQLESASTPGKIAKHERESQAVREPQRARCPGAALNTLKIKRERRNRRERKQALHRARTLIRDFAHEPVTPQGPRHNVEAVAIGQLNPKEVLRRASPRLVQCNETVAHRQSADAKALLLTTNIDLLRAQFVFELAGKVIKKVLPTHEATVTRSTDTRCEFSTAPTLGHGQPLLITA